MSLTMDQWHQRYLQQARWTHELRKYLFQKSNLPRASKILDVGCGTGVLENELVNLCPASLFGIDVDVRALAFAHHNAPASTYIAGDGLVLPFHNAIFDICLCHFLLLWVSQAQDIVGEMARVTRPGGYVVALAEPDYGGRIDFPASLSQIGTWQSEALAAQGADPFIGRQIRSIFAKAGLVDIEAGILGAQWLKEASSQEAELEWQVLASDLEDSAGFHDQADELRKIEMTTRKCQERILFVPVFYAIGTVADYSAGGKPISI